jgi:hypothetical protein
MPEPNYANGEPPGWIMLIVGTLIVAVLFLLLKSCLW